MFKINSQSITPQVLTVVLLGLLIAGTVWADSITYQDYAQLEEMGLRFNHVRSHTDAKWDAFREAGIFLFPDLPFTPLKSNGNPGTVIFDYDLDGDLDVYVTNGPGAENGLFTNQLREQGVLTFIDLAAHAGVNVPDQDSSGACFGDLDNDGDDELFVLSAFGPNRLFENNGDGTFVEISAMSGLANDTKTSVSCSFGDIDNDGLLDVVIANCCQDMSQQLATGTPEPFAFNQHNQLFRNLGNNRFADVSESSGILEQKGFPAGFEGSPTVTWAVAMVDYDLDGDVDIFTADDQAAVRLPRDGGVARGLIHLFENDGNGQFADVTVVKGLDRIGSWMGLSFGDVNGDGYLDVFGTNLGDWASTLLSPRDPVYGGFFNYELGDMTSRWFLGSADGTFSDPGVGSLVATPFGWGTSMADYDNDGDTDILYHGGLLPGPVVQTAPGVILENQGNGELTRDASALAGSTDHELRTVNGMAVGDLDDDGFVDIVSVSSFDLPDDAPLSEYNADWGSPFDEGRYFQFFQPTDQPFVTEYSGVEFLEGSLSLEISSGDNGNNWAKVELMGGVGVLQGARSNRNGFGAVVQMHVRDQVSTVPVIGGSSYASQDSAEVEFGLGRSRRADYVEVLWPGGTRNRLYHVFAGERIFFPEIPCSFDGDWKNNREYVKCVHGALDELRGQGQIGHREKARFLASALRARFNH